MRYGRVTKNLERERRKLLAREKLQRRIDRLNERIQQREIVAKRRALRTKTLAIASEYWAKVHSLRASERAMARLYDEEHRDDFDYQLRKAQNRGPFKSHSPKITFPLFIPFAPYSVTAYDWNAGYSTSTVTPNILGCYQVYRNQVGSVTPHFKLIKRFKRNQPLHNFDLEIRLAESTPYLKQVWGPGGLGYSWSAEKSFHKDWFQPNAYGDTVTSEALNKAAGRLADRINKMHVNVAQMYAERHQTVSLFINTANRIRQAAKCMRAGNFNGFVNALSLNVLPNSLKGVGKSLGRPPDLRNTWFEVQKTPKHKRLASHWLEYTFGWTPLLNDVYGSAELLASHAVGDLYHTKATGKAKGTSNRPFVSTANGGSMPYNGWMTEEVKVKYVVRYKLNSYARAALSQTGLDNPALLMWELLPYSFVADWSFHVAQFLQRLTAFEGFDLLDGTVTTIWKGEVFKNFHSTTNIPGVQWSNESGSSHFTQVILSRKVLSEFPGSAPTKLLPAKKEDIWWKLATSASLLRVVFPKGM